ncbi:MAG: gliding motility lipoprotein GldD [Bacteroidota bacterium]
MKLVKYLVYTLIAVLTCSCGEEAVPKPQSYFRIELPRKTYNPVDTLSCFAFELPDYAFVRVSPDMPAGERCWYNVYYPRFKAEVYLTYKKIDKDVTLADLSEDLYQTAYGHSVRADNITSAVYSYPEQRKSGVIYKVDGNVASQVQFSVTDSSANFVRGSLYFACTPNKDSLAPVVEFIRKDIDHMIRTFRWK